MKVFGVKLRIIAPVVLVCCLVCVSSPSLQAQQAFSFPNFSSPAGIQRNGSALVTSNGTAQVLRLTPAALHQIGSAWYTTQLGLANGFSTTFKFQIGGGTPSPGDGFAFVIQNGCFGEGNCGATALATSPSGEGGSIGYLGLTHSVAIEFDTFQNSGYADVSGDELGIQSCGSSANTPDHNGSAECNLGQIDLGTLSTPIQLADGNVHTATISYIPPTGCEFECPSNLFISIDGQRALSSFFNLGNLGLDSSDHAYVGFTAATGGEGGNDDNHDILSWSFTPNQQTATLGGPGTTTILTFNTDTYKITPQNNRGGEQLTVTAVLIPANAFPTGEGGLNGFQNETCVPYGDYSAALGVDTCAEFQVHCQLSATDATPCNFFYLLATGYDLPTDLPAIGGPDFLVAHTVIATTNGNCPLTGGSTVQSIFISYEATVRDPTTRGGSLGPSCFVATYTPGAPAITGTASRFAGWESPVVNGQLNLVKAGAARPLKFQVFDKSFLPVTNLSLCNTLNSSGGCADIPAVPAPWVNLDAFGVVCPNGSPINPLTDFTVDPTGNSGLLNQGGGSYQLNWKTLKGWKGYCANVIVTFDSGQQVVPAAIGFQFN